MFPRRLWNKVKTTEIYFKKFKSWKQKKKKAFLTVLSHKLYIFRWCPPVCWVSGWDSFMCFIGKIQKIVDDSTVLMKIYVRIREQTEWRVTRWRNQSVSEENKQTCVSIFDHSFFRSLALSCVSLYPSQTRRWSRENSFSLSSGRSLPHVRKPPSDQMEKRDFRWNKKQILEVEEVNIKSNQRCKRTKTKAKSPSLCEKYCVCLSDV